MLHRVLGEDEGVAAQDVVHVGALLRQQVDARQVGGGAAKLLVDGRAVDDQRRAPAELAELLRQVLGLGRLALGLVEHDEATVGLLARQRGLQRQLAHLLRQLGRMAAHHRAEDDGAAAELRRAQAALAGAARALLLVGLARRAADLADALGLVRALAALVELPVDGARQDILADRQAEDLVGEIDLADLLVVEIGDRQLHGAQSFFSAAGSATASAAGLPPRSAAGNGTSFGSLRFTASRT